MLKIKTQMAKQQLHWEGIKVSSPKATGSSRKKDRAFF
jgi:hypothetical protein